MQGMQSMQKYIKVCKSMQKYAKVCKRMQKYAKVCKSMQKYAKVCNSMQKYAKVCKSMQMCLDVICVRYSYSKDTLNFAFLNCYLKLAFRKILFSNIFLNSNIVSFLFVIVL